MTRAEVEALAFPDLAIKSSRSCGLSSYAVNCQKGSRLGTCACTEDRCPLINISISQT